MNEIIREVLWESAISVWLNYLSSAFVSNLYLINVFEKYLWVLNYEKMNFF